MRQIYIPVALTLAVSGYSPVIHAQQPDDVKALKAELEVVRGQLKAAEREIELQKREIELQKKEIELLKKEAKPALEAAKKAQSGGEPTAKATLGEVEFELIQCVRDPKSPKRVSFTFGMKSEKGIIRFTAPNKLALFDGDGAALDIKLVKGPALTPSVLGGPGRAEFRLNKGELSKYQIIVEGVKEDLASIDRVELTDPSKVVFSRIKIDSKK